MGIRDMIRRRKADTEPQYDEPVVMDEVWVRDENGKLVRKEDNNDEHTETGQ